ncbi:LytTR family DNA-binding domain-containing protein [Leptobacterium sp. I13]|uniref:LytR/AlgR family response regulator transcription factor n=1 Tax=Leptobacterium meishanense TaxID=3128904 RepID=UPI0030EB226F
MGNRVRLLLLFLAIPLAIIVSANEFILFYFRPQEFSNWVNDSLFYTISILLWVTLLPLIYVLIIKIKDYKKVSLFIKHSLFIVVIAFIHQLLANFFFYLILYFKNEVPYDEIFGNEYSNHLTSGFFSRLVESTAIVILFHFTSNNEAQIRNFIASHWPKLYALITKDEKTIQVINIKDKGIDVSINVHEIIWFESAGNYMKLHMNERIYVLRQTMTSLYSSLNTDEFIRVHRSYIVNVNYVEKVDYMKSGMYRILLKDKNEIITSRNYKEDIAEKLKLKDLPV